MPSGRSYSAGKFAMQLDGSDVGFCVSVEGGAAFASVSTALHLGERRPPRA